MTSNIKHSSRLVFLRLEENYMSELEAYLFQEIKSIIKTDDKYAENMVNWSWINGHG